MVKKAVNKTTNKEFAAKIINTRKLTARGVHNTNVDTPLHTCKLKKTRRKAPATTSTPRKKTKRKAPATHRLYTHVN